MSQNKLDEKVENAESYLDKSNKVGYDNLDPSLFHGHTKDIDDDPRGEKKLAGHETLEKQKKQGIKITSDPNYIDIGY